MSNRHEKVDNREEADKNKTFLNKKYDATT